LRSCAIDAAPDHRQSTNCARLLRSCGFEVDDLIEIGPAHSPMLPGEFLHLGSCQLAALRLSERSGGAGLRGEIWR